MDLPSPEELQKAWVELRDIHRQHLAVHDVVIPEAEHYADRTKAVWLAVLWHFKDRKVHKDEISAVVRRDIPDAAADQQIRHLKRNGWEIGPDPGQHQLNPYRPSSEWENLNARRRARLGAEDFNDIKDAFGGRCATCGAQEGRPDPRYGQDNVSLQQGHRDPHQAGDEPRNIIPQCQFCNRSYKDDFVFDESGRVYAVASEAPVRRATRAVQEDVMAWLLEQTGKNRD